MRALTSLAFTLVMFATGAARAGDVAIEFDDGSLPDDGTVIVGVYAGPILTPSADDVNRDLRGKLVKAIQADRFNGSVGRTLEIVAPASSDYDRVILSGLGEPDDVDAGALRDFAGAAIQRVPLYVETATVAAAGIEADGLSAADIAAEIGLGARLGAYLFDKYYREELHSQVARVTVNAEDDGAARSRYEDDHRALGDGVIFARDLINEPANVIYPESFVKRVRTEFSGLANVTIQVLDEIEMQALGMGALLGVGQGSARPPRLLVIRYSGAGDDAAPVAFVGKGVTFDTGGISIKDNDGMWKMKYDMSGAAAVTGTLLTLAKRGAAVNAVAVAALVENMPSAKAQRPGDVVTTMSGKTIEIHNTDAEGRLILSDAVWYTQEEFDPAIMVDLATLTGTVRRALGDEYAGVFSRHDLLAEQLIAAGQAAGEPLWRLPLHPSYSNDIASVIADIKNTAGHGLAGAGIGAEVIATFVREETVWAHLDIASTAWRATPHPTVPPGAAGYGVRLLDQLVRDYYEN